jgi:hypothetical protein
MAMTRVVVIAGALLVLAALARTMLPRYEVQQVVGEPGAFLRVDRWRGTVDLSLVTDTAGWLTVNGTWNVRLPSGGMFKLDKNAIEQLREKAKP